PGLDAGHVPGRERPARRRPHRSSAPRPDLPGLHPAAGRWLLPELLDRWGTVLARLPDGRDRLPHAPGLAPAPGAGAGGLRPLPDGAEGRELPPGHRAGYGP